MVSKIISATPYGFSGQLINVEGDLSRGLPGLQIVGLGNKAIDESKDRVRSAIKNSSLDFPKGKIIINLAPAELPKDGSQFDLPIALAILCLGGQLSEKDVKNAIFVGELALDGSLRPIRSAITAAELAKKHHISTIYVPLQNAHQASLVPGVTVIPVENLRSLFLHLKKEALISPVVENTTTGATTVTNKGIFIDSIYGQDQAKRALEIAVAGRHNLLLSGSPGSGKTMLAKALCSLLPSLNKTETIDVTKLHSLGEHDIISQTVSQRPFRSPHHTASRTSIIGGGSRIQPGEISLAHHGVLFMDELLEYPRTVLEALRQPLEDHEITISRANGKFTFPANFLLVATMNPCPCGFLGDTEKQCSCSQVQILNYQKKLSGPLLDRIDLTVSVSRVPHEELLSTQPMSKKQHLASVKRITAAQKRQKLRYKDNYRHNSQLDSSDLDRLALVSDEAKQFLITAAKKLSLSTRGYFKAIKVARTIADIEGDEFVEVPHIAESLQYRQITPL